MHTIVNRVIFIVSNYCTAKKKNEAKKMDEMTTKIMFKFTLC